MITIKHDFLEWYHYCISDKDCGENEECCDYYCCKKKEDPDPDFIEEK